MAQEKIQWVAELTINDGELEAFKSQAKELIATEKSTRPGTLVYDWYITEDGKTCYIETCYDGAAGAIAHLDGETPKLLPKLLEFSEFASLMLLSEVADPTLKEKLEGFGARFVNNVGGFTR